MPWLLTLESNNTVAKMLLLALVVPLPFLVASIFVICFRKLLLLLAVVIVVTSLNLSLLTKLNYIGSFLLHHSFDRICSPDDHFERGCLLYRHSVLPR